MGWRKRVLVALAALAGVVGAAAASLPVADVTTGAELVDIPYVQAISARGSLTIEGVAQPSFENRWRTPGAAENVPFLADNEVWRAFRVRNPGASAITVTVQVRQTALDEVALFLRRGDGWEVQQAGDNIPQDQWARPGRYGRFDITIPAGQSTDAYMRFRNDVPTWVPLQAATSGVARASVARADFALAFVLGALALLVVASLIQASVYRDAAYFLFGTYALLLGFALASISGVADELWWGAWPTWSDRAKTIFPLASAGVSVWLVRSLCRVATRSRRLAVAADAAGLIVVAVALGSALAGTLVPLVACAMALAAGSVVVIGTWTWRRGDRMGLWVLLSHVPIILSTALIVLRMAGVAPFAFGANVLVAVSSAFILVLLLFALIRRSKELLAVQVRGQGIDAVDALTGLLAGRVFKSRLRSAVERYRRSRHDAALLCIRVANLDWIRRTHGPAVAEQSMIRAAMKLQRVLHDADSFGRVGEGTMACIVETATHREWLQERAARLVAHGLMAAPGLQPPVSLVFHVAIGVVSEHALDAEALEAALQAQLDGMAGRTRRPIRFLDSTTPGVDATEEDALAA